MTSSEVRSCVRSFTAYGRSSSSWRRAVSVFARPRTRDSCRASTSALPRELKKRSAAGAPKQRLVMLEMMLRPKSWPSQPPCPSIQKPQAANAIPTGTSTLAKVRVCWGLVSHQSPTRENTLSTTSPTFLYRNWDASARSTGRTCSHGNHALHTRSGWSPGGVALVSGRTFGGVPSSPGAHRPATDVSSVAALLGSAPSQIGLRPRCPGLTCRYGHKAQVVCCACRAAEPSQAASDAPLSDH